jgi:hypothetical protein
MGTWSESIFGDDLAADIKMDFLDAYDEGKSLAQIRSALEKKYAYSVDDEDNGPVFWLALAKMQWDCGDLDADVLARVKEIVEKGRGLDVWAEAGPKAQVKRRKIVEGLYAQIKSSNPKPRARRKRRLPKVEFEKGDCLSLALPSGGYAAVIVLATFTLSKVAPRYLLGVLDWFSLEKPKLEDFVDQKWFVGRVHSWDNETLVVTSYVSWLLKYKSRFERVGRIELGGRIPEDKGFCVVGKVLIQTIEEQIKTKHTRR